MATTKKKTSPIKVTWHRLETRYRLCVTGKRIEGESERAFIKLLGHPDGSGFDFLTGERDLEWDLNTELACKAAIKKIEKLSKQNKIKVKVNVYVEAA